MGTLHCEGGQAGEGAGQAPPLTGANGRYGRLGEVFIASGKYPMKYRVNALILMRMRRDEDDSTPTKECFMATSRICEFLQGNGISYQLKSHAPAFTAQQVAEYTHIPGKHMAKTIVVWVEDRLALAVVPATKELNLEYLRRQAEARSVRLAEEGEFVGRFRGCQLGTVPPFGNLFGIRTYVDYDLTLEDNIAFSAGTHTDMIEIRFVDYMRTAIPCVVEISCAGDEGTATRQCCKEDEAGKQDRAVCGSAPTGAD